MQESKDRLLTVAEVATYVRVDRESVRRWLRDGKLLGINLGRGPGWRITTGDLQAFIDDRTMKPGVVPRERRQTGDVHDALYNLNAARAGTTIVVASSAAS